MSDAIYLTDLERCQPAEAFSPTLRHGRWQRLSYTAGELQGTMLIASDETCAPDIVYPLNLKGWHHIAIGLFAGSEDAHKLLLKLSGDRCYSAISLHAGWDTSAVHGSHTHAVHEFYWRPADLWGQHLHFTQFVRRLGHGDGPGARHSIKAKIAYIKLVPMDAAEVQALKADRGRSDTRRLCAHNDAHGYLWTKGVCDVADVLQELEPYRDSDFYRIDWECGGGDLLYYLGQAGRLSTCDEFDDFPYAGDRLHAEAWRSFRDRGIDPFSIALDYAHQLGLEFHAAYRPAGFFFPEGLHLEHLNSGGFYEQHPELRMIARNGQPTTRIAYTFPETRRYVLSLFREVAERYPAIDGVSVVYIRRPPLVGYEPPLVEGFKQEFGLDPHQLEEKDPRWLHYRCRILTQFMQELRDEMDAVARAQGRSRPLEITAMVSAREEENILHGMDVREWVARGLVDTLMPYTMAPRLNSAMESWPNPDDARPWVELVQGTRCRLSLSILPRMQSPEAYRRKAAQLYAMGAERFFFWDSAGPDSRANNSPSWHALRRLGHREEIEAWLAAGEPPLAPPSRPLTQLGSYDLSYATPG